MSKIIVDQIQKNGGDVLTLPATDATANNQPLVGSTTGVLSHSPLSLPAADGAANKPVTTDGSAQLQFGAFALPASAGTDGQVLTSTGSAAAWEALPATVGGIPNEVTTHVRDKFIGSIVTTTGRAHSYNSGRWTSDGPNGQYRSHQAISDYPDETWNMLLGDGYPNTGNDVPYVNNAKGDSYRDFQFAHGNRLGHNYKEYYHHYNQTSYSGLTFRGLPIRNIGSSDVTAVFYPRVSSYGDGYSGAAFGYYTPTNSSGTAYSTVTGGSWTSVATYNSSSQNYDMGAQNVTVPAGKTVIVVLVSAHHYATTYRFVDTNWFYSLDTTFTNADIICDGRMLFAMQTARSARNSSVNATNAIAYPYVLWQDCAKLYGDR